VFKLCYNSNGFRRFDMERTLDDLHEVGYQAIEISCHRNHLDPLYHSDKYLHSLSDKLKATGISVVNLHTGAKDLLSDIDFEPSLTSDSKNDRQKRIDLILSTIAAATAIGAKNVTITSGILPEQCSEEEGYRRLRESIDTILAKSDGTVNLLIENEMGMLVERVEHLAKLLPLYQGSLWATLDIGHAQCTNEDICEAINSLGASVKHMHFEDIKDRVHNHLLPGDGDIDFGKIVKLLSGNSYEGYCSVELYTYDVKPAEAALYSLNYFKRFNYDKCPEAYTASFVAV